MALEQLVNALVFGSVLTLFSLGLSLAWGTLGVLNLAHGSLFVFAGYLAYVLTTHTSIPFILVLVISMIGIGIASAAMELLAFRHVRTRFKVKRQAELSFLVASIGASTIVETFVSNKTNSTAFAPAAKSFHVHNYHVGSLNITNIEIIIVVVAVVVAVAMDQWVRRSRQGRAVRALAYSPDTSSLMGVNVNLIAAGTMFVAGLLAGLAGVLLAVNLGGEDVSVGQDYLLTAFAILIVGGVGSVRGAIAAAYVIAIAETAVVAYGPSNWQDGVAFLLILVILLIRPQGLFARQRFERA
jgi:branched-chain amino acid transport system permease protein